MKILFYISTIRGGGAARVLVALANAFSNEGNAVVFVTNFPSSGEYDLNDNIKRINLEAEESKAAIIQKNYMRCSELRRCLKEEKADLAISFMRENNFRLLFSSLGLKMKTLISVRNDPNKEYKSLFSKMLAMILYLKADGVVFQTRDAQKWFPVKIQEKSKIIMNQVDRKFFAINHMAQDYYIATGRLSQQKNYAMLIKAFAKFSQKYQQEQLYIYGEGGILGELQHLVKALDGEKNIHFMGMCNDIPEVLSRAKGFVLSSNYEGMPNGLLEAMAAGLPCISTDCPCGGPSELIEHGVNGLLIAVGNEDALYDALVEFHNNPLLRDTCAENAKTTAKTYQPEKIFVQWDAYIREIVAQK